MTGTPSGRGRELPLVGAGLSLVLLAMLGLPVLALAVSTRPAQLWAGFQHPLFVSSLWLSLRTSALGLAIVVLTGTPLAWALRVTRGPARRVLELLVDLPIVLPPAVLGVALLQAYGQRGLLGPALSALGVRLPFTTAAVVVAQVVVSAPFYVQSAATAFRKVDADLLLVARTLGASPREAWLRVAVPVALPGLLGGAALSWARALGEFGATLLFAGSLPGRTQTMPLSIYGALESDLDLARVLALSLAALASLTLLGLRLGPGLVARLRAALAREAAR